MSEKYLIGIIGTGRIANRFFDEAKHVEEAEVVGTYNPHLSSAKAFADNHGIKAYESLKELFDEVDIVYVASPHATHVDYARQAIEAKKHVLCEKPMSFVKEEAVILYKLAQDNGVVLAEAVKTAFCPGFKKVLEAVESGIIGEVKYVDGAFTKLMDDNSREMSDPKVGGSFLELGTYGTLPVLKLLGTQFDEIRFDSILNGKGIDRFTRAILINKNGIGNVVSGLGVKSDGSLTIAGTKGYILVKSPWWLTKEFEVHFEDPNKVISYQEEYEGAGLRYELRGLIDVIAGRAERLDFLPEESIALAGIMEQFLEDRGN